MSRPVIGIIPLIDKERESFWMLLGYMNGIIDAGGIQLINVLLGDTLYQDLKTQKPSNIEHHQCPPYDVPVHSVKLKKDMPLYLLIKKEIISVNSYHHQAIKNIAPKLSAMAYSEDGLIEAICAPEKKFVWATQWHPEFLFKKDNDNLKILKEFVKSCT